MATISQFAAPGDGEASSRSAYDVTPLDPPAAPASGDGLVARNPQGRRGLILRWVAMRWALDPQEPTNVATVSQLAAPQGAASYSCDLRKTYLRWAPQEPTKVATVSQFAVPRDTEASF